VGKWWGEGVTAVEQTHPCLPYNCRQLGYAKQVLDSDMKLWLKRILWASTAVMITSIIGLEVASRTCKCKDKVDPDFMRIKVCEQEQASYGDEELAILENLKADRAVGFDVSKETYREAMDALVKEIDPALLGPAMGVVCGVAYVRNSIPTQATLFVKRHEFEHLLQDQSIENHETAANIAAAKEYPVGLVQTVFYGLREAKRALTWCCFLVSSWTLFKLYFLGIDS